MKPAEALKLLADEQRKQAKRIDALEKRVAALTSASDPDWDIDDPTLDIADQAGEIPDFSDLPPEQQQEALAAHARLASDKGKALAPERYGVEPTIVEGDDGIEVEVPTASEEQKELRKQFAPRLAFEHLAKDTGEEQEVLEKAWIIGGPIWLHAYNRDFVIGLPEDVRRAFVHDVEQQSPTWAQELGRDILKDHGAGGPEITIKSFLSASGS